jgi:hypothetical protein
MLPRLSMRNHRHLVAWSVLLAALVGVAVILAAAFWAVKTFEPKGAWSIPAVLIPVALFGLWTSGLRRILRGTKILPALCGDPACAGSCHAFEMSMPTRVRVKGGGANTFEPGTGWEILYQCDLCERVWDSSLYKSRANGPLIAAGLMCLVFSAAFAGRSGPLLPENFLGSGPLIFGVSGAGLLVAGTFLYGRFWAKEGQAGVGHHKPRR